jgi:ABC-type Fe3+/spermidine/putrescine transport system ATPase subunit
VDEVLGREHQESRARSVSTGALALSGITKRFGDHVAVDNLTIEIPAGELLALIGASGSGKTTTLRIAAGYESPDSGSVMLGGKDITQFAPQKREFGMVFQHYALFPHMNVAQNVAFGLEARRVPRAARLDKARVALQSVGLGGADARPVQSLSGGEQQRVALARALVINPRALLLDEPLSNLDPTLRESTREELRAVLHRAGVPALFVTHDQEDAFAIADRIALIERGHLLQTGTPEELYDRPASLAVARFMGRSTILPAEDRGDRGALTIGGVERTFGVSRPGSLGGAIANAHVILRPDALEVEQPGAQGAWNGRVVSRRVAGGTALYRVELEGGVTVEVASSNTGLREDDPVGVRIAREPLHLVPG